LVFLSLGLFWGGLLGSGLYAPRAFAEPPSQRGGDPIADFSNAVCNGNPDAALKSNALPKAAGNIDGEKLNAILTLFHPATREATAAVRRISNSIELPSETELGSESKWNGVKLQTESLMQLAFGQSTCAASIAHFDKGIAHLTFIATTHVHQTPEARDAVFKTIQTEFEKNPPLAVVIEGYPSEFPCSEAIRIFLTPVSALRSESEYVAKLALERGLTVTGGEPNDLGMAKEDGEKFQLLRQMTLFQNQGITEGEAYGRAQSFFPFGAGTSFSDFKAWYQRVNGREFRLENALSDITPSYNLPKGETPRGTHKITDLLDLNRDSHALKTTRRSLLSHGKVLVIYGRDHLPRQLPVLESVFGSTGNGTPIAKCGSSASSLGGCPGP
jgi:hypothetical protein